jgi:hypothetical protein
MPEENFETPQPIQPTEAKPTNWPKIILSAVFGFALLAASAYAGYCYGAREISNLKNQISNLQLENQNQTTPTPTPTPEPTPTQPPTTIKVPENWKVYRNEVLGFGFGYPEGYEIITEDSQKVSLGFGTSPDLPEPKFPYLTITPSRTMDPTSLKLCSENIYPKSMMPNETRTANYEFPCLSEDYNQNETISEVELDKVNARSFYVLEGITDSSYHIVQTTEPPIVEIKMNISGGGLEKTFNQILSTFRFLD